MLDRTKWRAASLPACLVGVGLLLLLGTSPVPAMAEASTGRAASIEAAWVRHIAHFATWPEGAFASPEAPLVIGVLGDDASGVAAIMRRRIERGELSAQSRRLVIRQLSLPGALGEGSSSLDAFRASLRECHLLYLSRSERSNWTHLRRLLAPLPIVTVSEIEGFSLCDGMIEFVYDPEPDRVVMHIDLDTVRQAQLKLSSRLLDLKRGVILVKNGECPLGPEGHARRAPLPAERSGGSRQ